jgi:serine/threonine-protein kinase
VQFRHVSEDPLKQLGKYQLTDVLGEGAMGVVYRAFDPVLNRFVAIKVMNAVIAQNDQLRERFLREARAAGSLQHPNVVTIYDFGEVDSHLFIAMEYIEGADLAELIDLHSQIPVATKLDIIIDTLNGLSYAHTRGLVHRDIKPANIRVSQEAHAKLMDFGIARVQSSELTKSGEMIGTPQYMAPEQVMGGAVSPATDIFAVASVLYEFLSYAKPFHGETLHAVLFNVVSAEPRPIREVVAGLPKSLEAVFAKAHAKEPADRYENAVAMTKDLSAVRAAVTGAGEAPTVAVRTSALRTAIVASMAASKLTSPRPPTAAVPRRKWPLWTAVGVIAAAAVVGVLLWKPWSGTSAPLAVNDARGSAGAPPPAQAVLGSPAPAPTVGPENPAPQAPAPTKPTTRTPAERPGVARPAPPERSAQTAAAAAPAEDSLLRSVRAAALNVRRRAVDAGATAADLLAGDSELNSAELLIGQGRGADAVAQLSTASTRWADAERIARDRATARAADPPRQVAAPPISTAPPAPVVPAPVPPAPVDPRPDIERVIAAYARALESASMAEVRRAYPGLTPQEQDRWDGFFKSVKNLKAKLAVEQVSLAGNEATVSISGVYEFDNRTTGKAESTQVHLRAALTRDTGSWRLMSVR